MAKGTSFKITVGSLREMQAVPGWLEDGQRRTVDKGAKRIAEAVGKAAPHQSGALMMSWQSRTLSSTKAVISSDSKYARKVDKGAFIVPHGHPAIRFGGQFRKWVRFAPQPFIKRGLARRGSIMRSTFAEEMGKLG